MESSEQAAGLGRDQRWWNLSLISLARLMVMLDMTIVNIALPWAQKDLGISNADRQWVITAYSLSFGGVLLIGGRVADRIGQKQALVIGALGFAVASAVGGAATDPGMLLTARAVQGIFAAVLTPSTMSLITVVFTDARERAKAFSLFSSAISAGGMIGLVLGGVLTNYLSWRWCMYVNAPIAVLVALGALRTLPSTPRNREIRFDYPGAILVAAGMVAVTFSVSEAAVSGWHSPAVIASLGGGIALLAAFAVLQGRVRHPLLPLRVFASRNRNGGLIVITLTMFAMFGTALIETYQLQVVMGYSPLKAGLGILPATVATVLAASQIAGRLSGRIPARLLVVPGLLVAAAGSYVLVFLQPTSSFASRMLPAEILLGLGVGSVMSPCISAGLSGVQRSDAGVTAGLMSAAQQVGGSIGTALLNTLAVGAMSAYLIAHGASAHPSAALAGAAQDQGLRLAAGWATASLLAAAVAGALLITAGPRTKAATDRVPAPARPVGAAAGVAGAAGASAPTTGS